MLQQAASAEQSLLSPVLDELVDSGSVLDAVAAEGSELDVGADSVEIDDSDSGLVDAMELLLILLESVVDDADSSSGPSEPASRAPVEDEGVLDGVDVVVGPDTLVVDDVAVDWDVGVDALLDALGLLP